MQKVFLLIVFILFLNYSNGQDVNLQYTFVLTGKVIGQDTGRICLSYQIKMIWLFEIQRN